MYKAPKIHIDSNMYKAPKIHTDLIKADIVHELHSYTLKQRGACWWLLHTIRMSHSSQWKNCRQVARGNVEKAIAELMILFACEEDRTALALACSLSAAIRSSDEIGALKKDIEHLRYAIDTADEFLQASIR